MKENVFLTTDQNGNMEIYTILHRKIALFAYVTAHVEIVCNWLDWDYHLK